MTLPDFKDPPVTEIVLAVQFRPLPQFGMPEAIEVAKVSPGWRVIAAPPALDPIVEPPPGQPMAPGLRLGFGVPPIRVLLEEGPRWLAQLQQDRVAVHERRDEAVGRPSFKNVVPRLAEVRSAWSPVLRDSYFSGDADVELIEVTYLNWIPVGSGWDDLSELHKVLKVVNGPSGADLPFERVAINLSSVLVRGQEEAFNGRLLVSAEPASREGIDGLHMQLISRRYVAGANVEGTMGDCHEDIVKAFAELTTENMHTIWGRYQ